MDMDMKKCGMREGAPVSDSQHLPDSSAYSLRPLTWPQLYRVYTTRMQEDFPPEEIKPLALLERLYAEGVTRAFGLFDAEDRMPAYAIFEKPASMDVWLLDYLAVDKNARGSGLGSLMIQLFEAVLATDVRAILLEIERLDCASDEAQAAVRVRRKRFYLKNHLYETGVFSVADGGMDYEILCLPLRAPLTMQETAGAMEVIYRTFFTEGMYAVYTAPQEPASEI